MRRWSCGHTELAGIVKRHPEKLNKLEVERNFHQISELAMKQIFINLPVKDVEASMDFYMKLGFIVNPMFTFNDQKCMVWSDQIYVMLQSHEMFKSGDEKNVADPSKNTIATFTLPVENIEKLNEILEKGLKAGGTEPTPMIDEGFMQLRNIEDLDGHNWGIMFLDIDKFKEAKEK